MKTQFYKYQAFGNDMLVLNPASFDLPLTPAAIRRLCDRHFGLGADGICYGPWPAGRQPPVMRFFNPDGSEAAKSGNGLRIFARYLWEQGYVTGPTFELGIGGEIVNAEVRDEQAQTITTTLGRLSFWSEAVPVRGPGREVIEETLEFGGRADRVTAVSLGNPHCVIFRESISADQARAAGPLVEQSPHFPNRTNVQFGRVLDQHTITLEIWERGAGYTLASGSSAAAAAGAAIRTGRCRSPVEVRMAGGTAYVVIDETWQASLTGRVEAVCQGTLAGDFVAKVGE